jgi:hypothetical protein
VYRKTGRNGDTLDPASVRAGVAADGWLPHTARAMAYLLAQGTSLEAEATGRELARLPYSRSSFERAGHEVGRLYRRAQARIEEVLIQEYARPTGGMARNGSDEDWRRSAGLCNEVNILESHPTHLTSLWKFHRIKTLTRP